VTVSCSVAVPPQPQRPDSAAGFVGFVGLRRAGAPPRPLPGAFAGQGRHHAGVISESLGVIVGRDRLGADPEDPSSRFFAGPTGAEYFRALPGAACGDKKQTIRGVPVDLRESSDSAFQAMIQRTNHEDRHAVLCNTGGRGTGTTVLLLRDCLRFVSNRGGYADQITAKHGKGAPLALYVTFHDDQKALLKPDRWPCERENWEKSGVSERQFAAGICARIYDRVMCTPPTGRCANPTDNNYNFEELAERLELSAIAAMSPPELFLAQGRQGAVGPRSAVPRAPRCGRACPGNPVAPSVTRHGAAALSVLAHRRHGGDGRARRMVVSERIRERCADSRSAARCSSSRCRRPCRLRAAHSRPRRCPRSCDRSQSRQSSGTSTSSS